MSHADLIGRETAISVAINMAISAGFFLLVFGRRDPVPLAALGYDCLPQAFMVALMGGLVPGLLTRRRVRRGTIAPLSEGGLSVPVRSVVVAVIVTVVLGGGAALTGAMSGDQAVPFLAAGTGKILFGGAIAALVTPSAVRAALAG